MGVLSAIPAVISLLLLGAHFTRHGGGIPVAAVFVLLALLFVRRPWARRIVQVALAVGALEWVRTLSVLWMQRSQAGEPATRLVLILGGVAAFTAVSAWLLRPRHRPSEVTRT